MTSPHFQLAQQIETSVTAWAVTNWVGVRVEAGFRIESFGQIVKNESPQLIAIIPTSVVDDVDGQAVGDDQDLITISLLILTRLKNTKTTTIAAIDSLANNLRRHLKTFDPTSVTVADGVAELPERRTVNYLTVYDHNELNAEIFASAIECTYSLSTGALA